MKIDLRDVAYQEDLDEMLRLYLFYLTTEDLERSKYLRVNLKDLGVPEAILDDPVLVSFLVQNGSHPYVEYALPLLQLLAKVSADDELLVEMHPNRGIIYVPSPVISGLYAMAVILEWPSDRPGVWSRERRTIDKPFLTVEIASLRKKSEVRKGEIYVYRKGATLSINMFEESIWETVKDKETSGIYHTQGKSFLQVLKNSGIDIPHLKGALEYYVGA